MNTFTAGKTYKCRSICDSDMFFSIKVISRTAKTLVVDTDMEKGKKLRVFDLGGIEAVRPMGNYSMCPVIRAA